MVSAVYAIDGNVTMRLDGKTAIITGASGGFGAAMTRRFSAEGARVLACDWNLEAVETLAAELSAEGSEVRPRQVDVSDSGQVTEMVDAALAAFGRVDILINNAGISPKKEFLDYTEDDWDAVHSINLKGEYLCARAVCEHMMENEYGRIVNFSSSAWRSGGFAGGVPYTAAKAGVVGLTRSLAKTLGPYGITVNAIAPGPSATGMTDAWLAEWSTTNLANIPLGRVGQPDDIANAALFLASDEAEYITGICLDVNGGIAMGG
jgi:NAD(P)-dependent dehydrogenase (short-subunit alcohol dehydrogenase family)